MGKYILIVTANAQPGEDDEFNRWYDDQHLGDVCQVPGVAGAKRFSSDPSSPHPTPANYMTIYDLETDDPGAVVAEISRRGAVGEFPVSPALDATSAQLTIYKVR